ncbi:MAG: glycoside hydrolase [Cytophagaceae bacterium]|nr:glycoside hydrolase [Cytophagaceae bacterium]|tara:strand:- start:1688 stop:1978 length:291 start_codon:yes stop_codon:yes gene_type:complete
MPFTKQYLKSKPQCKVTFTFPAKEASSVAVAGDFNAWEKEELKKLKNGTFKGSVNVPIDTAYEYKFLVDGAWVNDAEADRYQWNDFAACENSVVEI